MRRSDETSFCLFRKEKITYSPATVGYQLAKMMVRFVEILLLLIKLILREGKVGECHEVVADCHLQVEMLSI